MVTFIEWGVVKNTLPARVVTKTITADGATAQENVYIAAGEIFL